MIKGVLAYIYFIFLFCGAFNGASQSYIRADFLQRIDQGTLLMEQGYYDSAQTVFLFVLNNMSELPSDISYYFGRNSYHLNEYKQSINWLNKYIQLKGVEGRFYDIAIQYLKYAEAAYQEIQQQHASNIVSEWEVEEYNCGGLTKMLCPVCHGSGVIIQKTTLENFYQMCPYSLGEGYLSCDDYNLFMRGDLTPQIEK